MREVREWWEATAGYFQAEAAVEVGVDWGPGVTRELDVLPDVDGRDVLELGCGGGQFGVGLAERGARVVGVDLSRAQLEHAATLAADRGVSDRVALLEGTVTELPVAADAVDLAVSAYALQWVPDLEATAAEAARVLRPGGHLVVSMPHPFYTVFDPETRTLTRSYHEPGPTRTSHEGIDPDEVLFRRRMGDIHAALRGAGFDVEALIEPGTADPEAYEARWSSRPELMARVPRTLVVRARLPAG